MGGPDAEDSGAVDQHWNRRVVMASRAYSHARGSGGGAAEVRGDRRVVLDVGG